MPASPSPARDLAILQHLESNPDTTQAHLAEHLGLAVGTVNYALRRLIRKGYVRVQQMQRRRLKYLLTPSGLALRARLAVDSLNYGMRLYRETRAQARALLAEAQRQGHRRVQIDGRGDLADIARLTCLEMGLTPQTESGAPVTLVAHTIPLTLKSAVDPGGPEADQGPGNPERRPA